MNSAANRTYLVTGVSGQDGFYSARRFLRQGARVVGTSRHELQNSGSHVRLLAQYPRFEFVRIPEYTKARVMNLIRDIKPDRIAHAAGFRDLPSNESEVAQCYFTNCDLVELLLKAAAEFAPRARFLFISSAEIFGKTHATALSERSPLSPQNHYAISKVQGMKQVADFRTARIGFAASAICFNHESFLSPPSHLARLVPDKLLKLKHGKVGALKFYNTGIRRDWSHAKDFAEAFDLMLEHDTPTDFVVASGKPSTLREYIDLTCDLLRIRSQEAIEFEDRADEDSYDRVSCPEQIQHELRWKPAISLCRLCREMIRCARR